MTAAAIVTFRRGTGVLGVIMSVLGLASGAFFPLALLPDWLQTLAEANPVAIAMEGTREALIGGAGWERARRVRSDRALRDVGRRAVRRHRGLPRRAVARAPPRHAGALLMFEHVDRLLAASASPASVLRVHRVELLEARRRRAAGLELESDLIADETRAAVNEMAVTGLLARDRRRLRRSAAAHEGPGGRRGLRASALRSFGDLDILTDDAPAAQAALIAAGFQEVFDPEIYEDIHHLRPLWWPGLPLVIELHMRPNWPAAIPAPVDRGAARRRRAERARRARHHDAAAGAPHARSSPRTPGSTRRSAGSGT